MDLERLSLAVISWWMTPHSKVYMEAGIIITSQKPNNDLGSGLFFITNSGYKNCLHLFPVGPPRLEGCLVCLTFNEHCTEDQYMSPKPYSNYSRRQSCISPLNNQHRRRTKEKKSQEDTSSSSAIYHRHRAVNKHFLLK